MDRSIRHYLGKMILKEGSDLHLQSGSSPFIRINGKLRRLEDRVLTADEVEALAKEILGETLFEALREQKEIDHAYTLEQKRRFRINIYHELEGLSIVVRAIPPKIPTIEELNLPEAVGSLANLHRGLVLVTGVTGSGKSTTMAAILDKINANKAVHIISVEDPIEFVHDDRLSLVSQRAVGSATHSFADALRAAMREDLDVLYIGELRDFETAQIALHAANTGHLVFSTLHTSDAKETITRLLAMFPKEDQERVRMTLSFVLEGIVSQRLVHTKAGGLVPAVEVFRRTKRLSELIAESRDDEITDAIAKGKESYQTQTFDQSLLELYRKDKITFDEALRHATSPNDLRLALEGISHNVTV